MCNETHETSCDCIVCQRGEHTGVEPEGTLIAIPDWELGGYRIESVNQNGSKMTLTLPGETNVVEMLRHFERILSFFGFADYKLVIDGDTEEE